MHCQTQLFRGLPPSVLSRRWFLQQCGVGLGSIALTDLMRQSASAEVQGVDPLASRQPHHAAKAKAVIFLFMAGPPSHLELFDYKPELARFDGTLPPPELIEGYRAAFINPNSTLLGPKFAFAKHGECGAELSELLPHLAEVVDDIAIVKSMSTDAFNHAPGQIFIDRKSTRLNSSHLGISYPVFFFKKKKTQP